MAAGLAVSVLTATGPGAAGRSAELAAAAAVTVAALAGAPETSGKLGNCSPRRRARRQKVAKLAANEDLRTYVKTACPD
jgi:hypothetical protein